MTGAENTSVSSVNCYVTTLRSIPQYFNIKLNIIVILKSTALLRGEQSACHQQSTILSYHHLVTN